MWKFVDANFDCFPFWIDGINVWAHERLSDGDAVKVIDPLHNTPHTAGVYRIAADGKTIRFAMTEFSMCMWGFFRE